mmetsp:Transcript_10835/g.24813  ORF Transcript_10835/g.24813 Transcript_10835/m.24813 type:complete len:372 (+) Transcript_10835:140-1255(+)
MAAATAMTPDFRHEASSRYSTDSSFLLLSYAGSDIGTPSTAASPTERLQAKAQEKQDFVQRFIRRFEKAQHMQEEEDWRWLSDVSDPKDPLFRTLVTLLMTAKYEKFVGLRCIVLRAIQMVLRFAIFRETAAPDGDGLGADHSIGMRCFAALAGEALANEAVPEVARLALGSSSEEASDNVLSHNSLLVLAELGPEKFEPRLASRLLDSFVTLEDRADELVEVALRMHAWGGKHRKTLLKVTVTHPGRTLLGEVLIQVVNKCDPERRFRAIKVLKSCLLMPTTENLLFTNDACVLVEILLRELPNQVADEVAFAEHIDCFKVLTWRCDAARTHRRDELVNILTEISEEEGNLASVRAKSAEALTLLAERAR